MNKLVFSILVLSLVIPLASCARIVELQPVTTRSLNFSNFTAIVSDSKTRDFLTIGSPLIVPVELSVTKSDGYQVVLTANQNIFDFIQISQTGELLKITVDNKKIANRDAVIKVEIAMPELKSLKLNHGDMQAALASTTASFNADIGDDSKLNIDLQSGPAFFTVSSSSEVAVSGSASELTANISGDSNFNCSLKSPRQTVRISSASDVILRGETQDLQVDISGDSALDLDQQASATSLKMSSASDITGKLKTANLTLDAYGDSRIEISGSAENAVIKASSASDVLMPDLAIKVGSVTLDGASRANLQVSTRMDINLSSASELKYQGAP